LRPGTAVAPEIASQDHAASPPASLLHINRRGIDSITGIIEDKQRVQTAATVNTRFCFGINEAIRPRDALARHDNMRRTATVFRHRGTRGRPGRQKNRTCL